MSADCFTTSTSDATVAVTHTEERTVLLAVESTQGITPDMSSHAVGKAFAYLKPSQAWELGKALLRSALKSGYQPTHPPLPPLPPLPVIKPDPLPPKRIRARSMSK